MPKVHRVVKASRRQAPQCLRMSLRGTISSSAMRVASHSKLNPPLVPTVAVVQARYGKPGAARSALLEGVGFAVHATRPPQGDDCIGVLECLSQQATPDHRLAGDLTAALHSEMSRPLHRSAPNAMQAHPEQNAGMGLLVSPGFSMATFCDQRSHWPIIPSGHDQTSNASMPPPFDSPLPCLPHVAPDS